MMSLLRYLCVVLDYTTLVWLYDVTVTSLLGWVYNKTKQENWSAKIKTRRLQCYGHAMRLPEETPAKIALQEVYSKVKKLRGGQTTTWISVLEKDLSTLGLTIEGDTQLALDRDEWRKVVWQSRAHVYAHFVCN